MIVYVIVTLLLVLLCSFHMGYRGHSLRQSDKVAIAIISLLWPITIPIIILCYLCKLFYNLGKQVKDKL